MPKGRTKTKKRRRKTKPPTKTRMATGTKNPKPPPKTTRSRRKKRAANAEFHCENKKAADRPPFFVFGRKIDHFGGPGIWDRSSREKRNATSAIAAHTII